MNEHCHVQVVMDENCTVQVLQQLRLSSSASKPANASYTLSRRVHGCDCLDFHVEQNVSLYLCTAHVDADASMLLSFLLLPGGPFVEFDFGAVSTSDTAGSTLQ